MLTSATTEAVAVPCAPPLTLSDRLVTRIWYIADLRGLDDAGLARASGLPEDTLHRLYTGDAELTADQLVRLQGALDVHVMAIFDGITVNYGMIPPELLDHETAQLAARLHSLPAMARAMILAQAHSIEEGLRHA